MLRVSYVFIISLSLLIFSSIFASRGHSLLNIDLSPNYAYAINEKQHAIGFGVGVGFDIARLSPSVLSQLRISVAYRDFTLFPPVSGKLSEMAFVTTVIGVRFIFGNDDFPNWFSTYIDIGAELGINIITKDESHNFLANAVIGGGVEFFVWKNLYLGIGAYIHVGGLHYPVVGPVIGYRIR